jgi:tetratricopeptide (TPR) repeat protein
MKDETLQPDTPAKHMPPSVVGEADIEKPRLWSATNEESSEDGADDEEDGSRSPTSGHDLPGPAWQGYVFFAVPVLICLFGAGRETWSKGVAAVLLGAAMLLFPPQKKIPPFITLCFLAAVSAPLLAFLPSQWLQNDPVWRARLAHDWDIALSGTLTPQAFVTFEIWMLFALCATWLFWCLSRGFSNEQRRVMMYALSIGGILLCLLSIFEGAGLLGIPWWPRRPEGGTSFGPFANRNHISSIAAVTSMLCAACAYDAHRRKSWAWSLFALGFLVPVICIFINTSRAGVVLLFLGITTWLGTSAMGRGFFKKLTVTASLVLIISTLLVISSGGISSRLESQGAESLIAPQGRSSIYLKTLDLILQAPWLGCGLGNFDALFPQFEGIYNLRERPIHPESDLLWLLAEGGLLTLLPCLLVLAWLFSSTGPWFKRKKKQRSGRGDQRLRNAAAIAFGLGTIHGLVDVPFHGLGYFAFLTLLAGIALRPRRLPLPSGRTSQITVCTAGVGALVLGFAWLAISQGRLMFPGRSSAAVLRERASTLIGSGSFADALPLLNEAILQTPMDYLLYYERARVRLLLQHPPSEALADFSRARALEPNNTDMCFREGLIWLDFRPEYAIIPWREIMLRWPGYYYSTLLNHAEVHPELRDPLWRLATTAELKLEFLGRVKTREEFDQCLRSLLASRADLDGLEPAQRERLFTLWYQNGDPNTLISALESNKKWRADGWPILAEHYARNSEFERACQTVMPYLPSIIRTAPGTSTDIPTLERALLYNPTDARRGIDLFQAQKSQGDIEGALRTLEKVVSLPNAPAYIRQEIAALYMTKQDFRRAWEYLREAMQKR